MNKYVFAFTLCAMAAMADVAQVVETAKQVLSAKEAVEELVKIEKAREIIYQKTAAENEKRYKAALSEIQTIKEINFALKKNIELQNAGAKIQILGNEANLKINENLVTSSGADR
mgnify:CR=1 FL=1